MSSKILRIQFPSGKIPVRAQPDMKSDTLKLLCTGTEIEVLADLNSGYYVLANNQGYINKSIKGVEWIDITATSEPKSLRSALRNDLDQQSFETKETTGTPRESSIPSGNETVEKSNNTLSVKPKTSIDASTSSVSPSQIVKSDVCMPSMTLGATNTKCAFCDKTAFAIERVMTGGIAWHKGCFACGGKTNDGCKVKLALDNYVDHEGNPFCRVCHSRLHGLGSQKGLHTGSTVTHTKIAADSAVTAKIPAMGTGGPKCAVCDKNVYALEKVSAINNVWHKNCFACGGRTNDGCKKKLGLDNYINHTGDPFCKTCYGRVTTSQTSKNFSSSISTSTSSKASLAPVVELSSSVIRVKNGHQLQLETSKTPSIQAVVATKEVSSPNKTNDSSCYEFTPSVATRIPVHSSTWSSGTLSRVPFTPPTSPREQQQIRESAGIDLALVPTLAAAVWTPRDYEEVALCRSTQPSVAASPRTRHLTVICPGNKVPIRSAPMITASVVKFLYSGDEVEVHRDLINNVFYSLAGPTPGFVNRRTQGTQWIEVESPSKLDTVVTKQSATDSITESTKSTVVDPQVSSFSDASELEGSKNNQNFSIDLPLSVVTSNITPRQRTSTALISQPLPEAIVIQNTSKLPPVTSDLLSEITNRIPFTPPASPRERQSITTAAGIDAAVVRAHALTAWTAKDYEEAAFARSAPTSAASSPRSKQYRIICPGSKLPVRSAPLITAPVLRYLYSGDEVEVHLELVNNVFYSVVGPTLEYVNSRTHGSQWIEIERKSNTKATTLPQVSPIAPITTLSSSTSITNKSAPQQY